MANTPAELDLEALRKCLHQLNNHVGVILATAELLQLDQLPPKVAERCRTIEGKAIDVREILRSISDRYLT
jgi:hypothetical protein